MNSNYWRANEKARVSTDCVSIASENGLNFASDANTNIRLNIPKSIPFFIGDQSYLKFRLDLEFKGTAGAFGESSAFVQMIPELGSSGIIKNLTIRTHTGQIIEQIQNYNVLSLLRNKYDSTQDKDNIRSITEGTVLYDPRCRNTNPQVDYVQKLNSNNTATNPYFETVEDSAGNITTPQKSVDVCLPLHLSGIMGSHKVVPNGMLGLNIEIELEEASKIMRGNINAIKDDTYNPELSFGRTSAGVVGASGDGLAKGTAYNRIYMTNVNSINDIENNPFKIGEVIRMKMDDGTFETVAKISGVGTGYDSTGTGQLFVYYDLATNFTPVDDATLLNTIFSLNFEDGGLSGTTIKYTVSNVEYVIKRAEVEDDYLRQMENALKSNGGKINYEFPSYTNYLRQVLATELNSTINLPLQNSMARSLLCIPVDVQVDQIVNLRNIEGIDTPYFNLAGQNTTNFYQFQYNGRLHPNRVVDCSKNASTKSFNQIHILELEKALTQGNIPPNSLRSLKNDFVIGRALSVGSGYADTTGREFQLNVDYAGITQKNKLFNIFCAHIRRVEMSADGVAVII
jgi:hypothetical protein